MVNTSACGADTRGFDSRRPPFSSIIGVSPSGKARDFDSLMRWFESSYPSLLEISIIEFAGVAELADALDSKSSVFTDVPVRPRPPV